MTIYLKAAIKFEGVHYSAIQQSLPQDLEQRMVDAGVAVFVPPKVAAKFGFSDSQVSNNDLAGVTAETGGGDLIGPFKNKKSSGLANCTSGSERFTPAAPGSTTDASYTCVEQKQARGRFLGFRVGVSASRLAGATLENMKYAMVPSDLHNGNGLNWAPVLWGGSATKIFPPGLGTEGNIQTVMGDLFYSDLVSMPSIVRTDFPNRNPLIQFRTKFNAGFGGWWVNGGVVPALNTLFGLEEGGAIPASDVVTAPGAVTLVRGYQWSFIHDIKYYYEKQSISVWDYSDSLGRGQGTTSDHAGLVQRACHSMNQKQNELIYIPCNRSVSGMTHEKSYENVLKHLASGEKPNVLIFKAHSPNDGYGSDAIFDACMIRNLDLIERCSRAGIKLVIVTPCRWTPFTSDVTNRISIFTARIHALADKFPGIVVLDDFNLIGPDPANPYKSNPQYVVSTSDGHYNDAGQELRSNELQKYL